MATEDFSDRVEKRLQQHRQMHKKGVDSKSDFDAQPDVLKIIDRMNQMPSIARKISKNDNDKE